MFKHKQISEVCRLSKTFAVIVANYVAKPVLSDSMLGQIMTIPGCGEHSCPLIMLHKGMVMCTERLQSVVVFWCQKKRRATRGSHSMAERRVNKPNSAGQHS